MIGQTLAIIRNTFFESIRQPITLVILAAATLGVIFSNLLAGFTMEDDQRMMVDLGLSTVFLCGALLAAFIATNVLNREIENRTVLTVIAKPVSRPLFVVGKFLGVAGALALATIYMGCVFLLVEMHGVMQTVRDPIHQPVLLFGIGAGVLGLAVGVWCNYFYGMVFSSTVIAVTTPLAALAYVLCLMFDHDFSLQPIGASFNGQLLVALTAVTMAVLVLTAIAIAASTRLGQVMTLCVTLGVFLMGMLSDWFFGRQIARVNSLWLERASTLGLTEMAQETRTIELATGEIEHVQVALEVPTVPLTQMADGWAERLEHAAYTIGYAILPNFQSFWFSDALTQGHLIPAGMLGQVLLYGLFYIVVAMSLAVILFQRREVG
ncbi:MAG: ABC transporter permease [Planctomycetota bacterium]|jgi:ABC-type transport system involved in multi-copper enzyme maturation permease subunit